MAQGFPLWRISSSLRTLHPEIFVKNFQWRRHEGLTTYLRERHEIDALGYQSSPILEIYKRRANNLRFTLEQMQDSPFQICRELAAQGGTDYLIFALDYSNGERSFISFTSDSPEGFSPQQCQMLETLIPVLARLNELTSQYFATECLLKVYLSPAPTAKILSGQFLRGDTETLHAAIWFSDLRDFTRWSEQLSPEALLQLLNQLFDAQVSAIIARGGEVLKFIGDAILAIFPGEADTVCPEALAAAKQALHNVAEIQAYPDLSVGIGLHYGDLTYGNIGAASRLDFTVIGPHVNQTSRLEGLCKVLERPLLVSQEFAGACGPHTLRSQGLYTLKGVSRPVEVWG